MAFARNRNLVQKITIKQEDCKQENDKNKTAEGKHIGKIAANKFKKHIATTRNQTLKETNTVDTVEDISSEAISEECYDVSKDVSDTEVKTPSSSGGQPEDSRSIILPSQVKYPEVKE